MSMRTDDVFAMLSKRIDMQGATPAQIQEAVNKYLSENPVDSVTDENIKEALGYTPADQKEVTELNEKLVQEIDDLYNSKANAIINTVSGESIDISDSVSRLESFRVFGKSEQDTTTGKNRAKFANDKNVNRNCFSYTTETEKTIVATKTIEGGNFVARYEANLKAGVEYIITANGNLPIYYYSDELWGTMIQAAQAPFNVTPETNGTYVFGAYSEGDIGTSVRVSDFMVREASITSDTYEPYTGGTASPNPEYPQDIRSVVGNADEGMYGKNRAKFANEENLNRIGYNYTSETAEFIKATKNDTGGLFFARFEAEVKKGVTYTISAKENVITYVYEDELWGSSVSAGMLPHTFTASKDGVYVIGAINEGSIGTVVTLTNFQVEEGTVVTDYEPYDQKQYLPIPAPNGLHGIKVIDASLATYTDENGQMWRADEIEFERGVYVQKTISESRNKDNVFISEDKTYFFINVNEKVLKNTFFYCNIARHKTNGKEVGNAWFADDGCLIIGNLDASGNPVYSTVDELFNHIDNVEFIGILTDSIEKPLSEEEIEAYKEYKETHINYPSTPIINRSGAYMETSYVEDTKKYIDNKFSEIGDISSEVNGIVEPKENDIPKVFINGSIPRDKSAVIAELDYVSKTETFHAYIEIKCQGTSSMAYDKKNFTIKMHSDELREIKLKKSFKNWGSKQNKYVLKANYIDHSHARNIVSARLWSEVVASRSDYDSLPAELKTSPNNGAIDGFPIKVYTNGIYQGIYTWNIGKDDWMWNMDEDNTNHVLMCGETNTNDTYAETPCNFRALWSGINEQDWSVEVGANSDTVKNSLNALITCVKDTDDKTFITTIENHLDLQSAIDYWIHQYVICGLDGFGKNMLLGTYDLQKWIMGAYDMDSTFGLWWDGGSFVSSDFRCPEDYQEKHSLLFERITKLYAERVKERYVELRKSVYSISNMFVHFERFMDVIGKDLYAEDLEIYADIPSGSTNNIKQIRDYIKDRLYYCDVQFGLIEESLPN